MRYSEQVLTKTNAELLNVYAWYVTDANYQLPVLQTETNFALAAI